LKGCRDKAMLEMLLTAKLHVDEFIALNTFDVYVDTGTTYCHTGIGDEKSLCP